MLGEVTGFDLARRVVHTAADEIPYDYLVVSAGATHSYFGNDQWAPLAPGLKTIEDALEILSGLPAGARGDDGAWTPGAVLGRVADVWSYSASYLVAAAFQLGALPFLVLARRQNASSDTSDTSEATA